MPKLKKKEIQKINVLNEDENWHTGQLDNMSNEQLILIIHKEFVEGIKEISKLRKNKYVKINVLFYNAVFNEILGRLKLPTLKELYKKHKSRP